MNAINDNKKIKSILVHDYGWFYADKENKIIRAYEENGEMASVLWFELLEEGKVKKRINGKYVSIINYEKATDE